MPVKTTNLSLEEDYAESAQRYLESLPLEHFMEATPRATQREITLESLAVLKNRRSDVQVFNELLVQYEVAGSAERGQVVPDNMVVIWHEKIQANGSYDVPLQPVGPFWILEYVSKNSHRKDYVDNMQKYEQELHVPYYLLFDPQVQALSLYHHDGGEYHPVKANTAGRLAIRELEVEVGLRDDWVRFWYQGELLPLPAEWDNNAAQMKGELASAKQYGETERQRAEAEAKRAEAEAKRADAEAKRAEAESLRADQEKQAREAMARELAELKAKLNDARS